MRIAVKVCNLHFKFQRLIVRFGSSNRDLNVYGFPLSQPTRSVLHLCKENGIKYNFIPVDVFRGENLQGEFKKLNPSGLVPVITDDSLVLAESAAILTYLCQSRGLHRWFPSDSPKEIAIVNYWLHWNHNNTRRATTKILTPGIFPKLAVETEAKRKAKFSKSLTILENHFTTTRQDFLTSSISPSIADLIVLPELDQLTPDAFNFFDFTPFPEVVNYIERLKSHLLHYEDVFGPVRIIADEWKKTGKIKA